MPICAAQQQTVLRLLALARKSRGRQRVILAVGRDGIMLPIRHEKHYKEGGVATISVYDRRGRRLGTVYLGEMPEAKQLTLTGELTAFLHAVLAGCEGPLPRLLYLTDAGYHQTAFFKEVLSQMKNPRRPGQRLEWLWIIDYYHAASYVTKLAEVLFSEEKTRNAWARRMRRLLRDTDRGVIRVLQSAAQVLREADLVGQASGSVQGGVQLSAEAQRGHEVQRIQASGVTDRQRGDGSGVQGGVHPTIQTVGDDLGTGGRRSDLAAAAGRVERCLS